MNNLTLPNPPAVFTLGEIKLFRLLYHELSISELAIFFQKSEKHVTELITELALKRKEPSHA